jgi:deazaflavin-dependent oxidoreductase (nitroreductase family)
MFPYPTGWLRLAFHLPIPLWRLGFGPVLGRIILIMSQTGRRSGQVRRTPLEFHWHAGHPYVASALGENAQWVRNVVADPRVTVQTARGTLRARASRVTDPDELVDVYQVFRRRDPPITRAYLRSLGVEDRPDDVRRHADRLYMVRFDPTDEPTPEPVPTDLRWVLPLAALIVAAAYLLRSGSPSQSSET